MEGQLSYVDVGGASVAYRVLDGEGDRDLILVPDVFFAMESLYDDPVWAKLLDGLRSLGRVVLLDPTGTGASDPLASGDEWTFGRSGRDLLAVAAAAEVVDPVVIGEGFNAPGAAIASTGWPGEHRLVLFEPYNPWAWDTIGHDVLAALGSTFSEEGTDPSLVAPSRSTDQDFREWFAYSNQLAASPNARRGMFGTIGEGDRDNVRRAYRSLCMPTVIIRCRDADRESFGLSREQHLAAEAQIAGDLEEIRGRDFIMCGAHVDEVLRVISEFTTGTIGGPLSVTRSVEAVLFTDIADSTRLAGDIGDDAWTLALNRHDDIASTIVRRNGGNVIKTTGDGILATHPSITAAVRSAFAVREAMAERGLQIRAGIHVGDVEHRAGDVAGLTVNIAARVIDQAAPGTVLGTEAVVQGCLGTAFEFSTAGTFDLKGVPGPWVLHQID